MSAAPRIIGRAEARQSRTEWDNAAGKVRAALLPCVLHRYISYIPSPGVARSAAPVGETGGQAGLGCHLIMSQLH